MTSQEIRTLLYGNVDIFDEFDVAAYPNDIQGWSSNAPVFHELISEIKPRLIVEVGSWKGASAIHMSKLCGAAGLDTAIVCVDTWLGNIVDWEPENRNSVGRISLNFRHGYPSLYYQFLANVIRTDNKERIVPFPATSMTAALYLIKHNIHPDLVYLDGSHDYEDVLIDIRNYLKIVRPGGAIFGDDYLSYIGVQRAVNEMKSNAKVARFNLSQPDNWHWVMRIK